MEETLEIRIEEFEGIFEASWGEYRAATGDRETSVEMVLRQIRAARWIEDFIF